MANGTRMANGKRIAAAVLVLLLAGCERQRPILVLDRWWSKDYGAARCVPAYMKEGETYQSCVSIAHDAYDYYERTLKTRIADTEECHDIDFYVVPPFPEKKKDLANSDEGFQLTIDFDGARNDVQSWSVLHKGQLFQGEDGTMNLARNVCRLVKGSGGSTHE